MVQIKTINKIIYSILTIFIFCIFNHSSDASSDAGDNPKNESFPLKLKWPIDLEGGLDKRLHETFGLTNSDEINIRQGIVIINKIFDIQIFILGQITELKENIRVIQEEYDEAKKNIENIFLEPRNSNKFDYIKSISQKLNILSEDKAVTTKNGLYNIIKPILSIKQKLIFEGIDNKKSISKYLQILRNKIINSILNEYFKILKNEFKNELNKYFEIPNKVSEQDVTSIENNLLILIPKIKDKQFKLFAINADDIEFISSRIGFKFRKVFLEDYTWLKPEKFKINIYYQFEDIKDYDKFKIKNYIIKLKNNLEKYISEKKLTKFCEELFDLICELTPTKVFLEDYTWPKPEKRDYLDLGIAVPEFLKHSDDK